MNEDNLFMRASRRAWRFPSSRGELTVEQLWHMPLLAKNNFDLNTVARELNQAVKALGEESFVDMNVNVDRTDAEGKLMLVKQIIAVRQAEQKAAEQRVQRADQRRKILDVLERRDHEELTNASREDLLKKLAELEG